MSEKKKKRKKKIKALHVFAYLVMALQIVFFLALTVPNLFGYRSYAVTSDTMNPVIHRGDVIYVRNSNPSLLEENEIICFYPDDSLLPMTCRIKKNDRRNRSPESNADNERLVLK